MNIRVRINYVIVVAKYPKDVNQILTDAEDFETIINFCHV